MAEVAQQATEENSVYLDINNVFKDLGFSSSEGLFNQSFIGADQTEPSESDPKKKTKLSGLNPEARRIFTTLMGERTDGETSIGMSGRLPDNYLSGSSVQDFDKILGGSPKELSGAEKSMLFFLGMATNAGKAGSTFGGSAVAGATALGTGMLKRSADVRKYEREAPLKKLQLSNLIKKEDSERRKDRSSFRKEWQGLKEVIDMKDQVFAYSRLREAAAIDPDNPLARGVGDLALVFNFMKLLDPGSVVRESEFRAAADAGSLGNKVRNFYDKPLTGALFTPEVRADFVARATKFLEGRGEIYDGFYEQRKKIALGEGFREEEIPIVAPYTDWKVSKDRYPEYRENMEKNAALVDVAQTAQKAGFNEEESILFKKYGADISNHPQRENIEKVLKQAGKTYEILTPRKKIELLKRFLEQGQ